MNIRDCTGGEVNVEAEKMAIIRRFELDWVTEKVLVYEGLDGWVV